MSLALTYNEIRREVGRFLGFTADYANWPSDDATTVADAIRRGSRRFYFHAPVQIGEQLVAGHHWSFLEKELDVTLTASVFNNLPSDFLRMSEPPTIDGGEYPLEEVSESKIRDLQNDSDGIGDPVYYAIKRNDAASDLAYRIMLYPTPTAGQVLSGWYTFDPPEIGASQEPIVPSIHAECFLESILAAADEMMNYETGAAGQHQQRFQSLLSAAVLHDQTIGSQR